MSFVEVLFSVGVLSVCAAMAVPSLLTSLDDLRTAGAVRYLTARLQQTRMQALVRTADTAVRFSGHGESYQYGVFVDGNRNGIRTPDVDAGIDAQMGSFEQLSDQFPGVEFGALAELPAVEAGGTPPGDDPIRLGVSDTLTFTPRGTATAGSVYILGKGRTQYAIRIYGETGRTRALRFDTRARRWRSL
jgi:type II secretory pathway pseudopilin PulG